MRERPWISGWFYQLALTAFGAFAIWKGASIQASVFLTGSIVIGANRLIAQQQRGD